MYRRSRRIELVDGLPSKQLLARIHHHLRGGDAERRAAAFYLVDFDRREEYKHHSYKSCIPFGEAVFGRPQKEIGELLRVGKELEKLSVLDRAFQEGRLGWSKLREVTRIATPETEARWLAFAAENLYSRVERAVAASPSGAGPPADDEPSPRPVTQTIHYRVPVAVNTAFQTAMAKLLAELPAGSRPPDALKAMAELVLKTDPEGKVPGRKVRKDSPYVVVLHVGANGGGEGRWAWVESEEGRLPIPLTAALEAASAGAQVIEVPDLADPGDTNAIRFGERGSVPREERDPPVPPAMKKAVLVREGYACAICRQRGGALQPHHLQSRANGGKTRIEFLLAICGPCHNHLHDQLVFLEIDEDGKLLVRDATGRLVWKEILPREALEGAPAELGFTEVGHARASSDLETEEEKIPARGISSSQVVPAPHPEMEDRDRAGAPVGGAEGELAPTDQPQERSPAAESSPAGDMDRIPARGILSPEVLAAPHPLLAAPTAVPLNLAAAALSELPAVITAAEWRALDGRIDWSRSRGSFILREPEARDLFGGRTREGASLAARAPALPASSSRPRTLAEVIGQGRVVENLALAVRGARSRGEALGHVLLSGPPGLGKTTLSLALAGDMGAPLHAAFGATLTEPHQVALLLARLGCGHFLFIDEIHRLPAAVTESLHAALEDRVLDVLLAERGRTRTLRIALEPFTLVGATMEAGSLPEPFRARFRIEETLALYPREELMEIVARRGRELGLEPTAGASAALACRARGTPRLALGILARARDLVPGAVTPADPARVCPTHPAPPVLTAGHVEEAARRLGIDGDGLRAEDLAILRVLAARGRPMGIETLAATLRMDPTTLRHVHEPYLLEQEYIVCSHRGREATPKARARLAAA